MTLKKSFLYFTAGIVFLLSGSISAEKRLYRYHGPLGEFVPEFIDTMTGEGLKFAVKSVYNEKNDGKQGFVMMLKPSGNFCEVTFADKGKFSVISIYTQNAADMSRMNAIVLLKMKMVEVGAEAVPEPDNVPFKGGNGWPDPGVN